MDNQIVFDALSNTLSAAKALGEDANYQSALAKTIAQLPPMQIGRYGQLQEWLQDADDPKDEHRHISHLYGLYPSNQISPYQHPDLFAAAGNSQNFHSFFSFYNGLERYRNEAVIINYDYLHVSYLSYVA